MKKEQSIENDKFIELYKKQDLIPSNDWRELGKKMERKKLITLLSWKLFVAMHSPVLLPTTDDGLK